MGPGSLLLNPQINPQINPQVHLLLDKWGNLNLRIVFVVKCLYWRRSTHLGSCIITLLPISHRKGDEGVHITGGRDIYLVAPPFFVS